MTPKTDFVDKTETTTTTTTTNNNDENMTNTVKMNYATEEETTDSTTTRTTTTTTTKIKSNTKAKSEFIKAKSEFTKVPTPIIDTTKPEPEPVLQPRLTKSSFGDLLMCDKKQSDYQDCQFRVMLILISFICAILLIFGCCIIYLLCQNININRPNLKHPKRKRAVTPARLTAAINRSESEHYLPPINTTDIPMSILPPYNIDMDKFSEPMQIGHSNIIAYRAGEKEEQQMPIYAEINQATKSNRTPTPPPPNQHPSYIEPGIYANTEENDKSELPEPPLVSEITIGNKKQGD
jgi:hypothetical protein